jgi:hypothetical protein
VALLAASLSLPAMRGIAGPPHFAQVPADVNWLVHADIDALRDSTVFQHVFKTAATRWKSLPANLDRVNRQFGLDLAKDLHGMTVFGPPSSQQNAVLVMRADWAAETFRQKLSLAPHHVAAAEGAYEIHRFDRGDGGPASPVAAALWRPGTFVFAQAADDAKFGLEVLDGKWPGLSGASPLAAQVPDGTILVARMVRVGDRLPVESPLLKQTEQIDFLCGERTGECFVYGKLRAKSPEVAQQVKQVAEGLLAMARLRVAGDADLLKLLDRAEFHVDNRTVELDFRAPAADVARGVEKAMNLFLQEPGK